MSDAMQHVYLYVPPEEYAQVEAFGACWDEACKRWYIRPGEERVAFSQWLGDADGELAITSDEAYVAAAHVACVKCGERTEVIALYCERGIEAGMEEPLRQIMLSHIWGMDGGLERQLADRWPGFKKVEGTFANHCEHCGAVQEDYRLHAEPGDVFFGVARGETEGVRFTALVGEVRVGADYSFKI